MVPDVPAVDPVGLASCASDHDDAINTVDLRQCRVDVLFEWHGFAATNTLIGGDHRAARCVIDAIFERFGGEATEDDRVDGADTRTGEHGERGFGNHGHVDTHTVTLTDSLRSQSVREATNLNLELLIGKPLGVIGVIPLPDNRGVICALRQVPVNAVHGDVQLGVDKPAGSTSGDIGIRDRGPGRMPVEKLRLLGPKCLGVIQRLAIQRLVSFRRHMRLAKCIGNGIDSSVGHCLVSGWSGRSRASRDSDGKCCRF